MAPNSSVTRWLCRITRAQPDELAGALWAFFYFFCLLAGYYVLRPIRDEMAMQIGRDRLQELFTWVFATMLVLVPVFGWLSSRFPRRRLLPWLYGFFVLDLLLFWGVMASGNRQTALVGGVFYVWLSVFNLFAVSVFWSLMADLLHTEQARRLYGFIAAGGTAGALTGPVITAATIPLVGSRGLMLVAAGFLTLVIIAIGRLRAWAAFQAARHRVIATTEEEANRAAEHKAMGGSIWAGLRDVVLSPYLLGICVFLFCYSLLSTFLYFQQVELVPQLIPDSNERVRMLALVDLLVNVLTLLIQLVAFGALIRSAGITAMLVVMPIVSVFGFAALAALPGLATLVAFGALRRAGEYAISKPSRETLFNVLPPEQKYKAKNVIDTLVHRTGDTASGWIFTGLKGLGLSSTAMSLIAVPVAGIWLWVAYRVGQEARRRVRRRRRAAVTPATPQDVHTIFEKN